MSWFSDFVDKVLPGDPMNNLTQSTTDKWFKAEDKDTLEQMAPYIATALGIPMGDLGAFMQANPQVFNYINQVANGADPSIQGAGMALLGDYAGAGGLGNYGTDIVNAVNGLVARPGAETGSSWGNILGQLPGDIGQFFKANPQLGEKLGQQILNIKGGDNNLNFDWLKKLVPNIDLGSFFNGLGLGDIGNAVKSAANNLNLGGITDILKGLGGDAAGGISDLISSLGGGGKLDDYLRDYGIPLGLGYMAQREAKPYNEAVKNAMTSTTDLANQQGAMYNKYIAGQGWDWNNPSQITGQQAVSATGTPQTAATAQTQTQPMLPQPSLTPPTPGAQASQNFMNAIKAAFGATPQSANWNPQYDTDNSGKIDLKDLKYWKQTQPEATQDYNNWTRQQDAYNRQQTGQSGQVNPATGQPYEYYSPEVQPTTAGVSPYEQLIRTLAYGMENPLGSAEQKMRMGQAYDNIGADYARQKQQALEQSRGLNQPPEVMAALMNQLNSGENLARQGASRDMYVMGTDLGRGYQQQLMNALSPMFGASSQAMAGQNQVANMGNTAAQNVYDSYGGLAQALAAAKGQQDSGSDLDAVMAMLAGMNKNQAAAPAAATNPTSSWTSGASMQNLLDVLTKYTTKPKTTTTPAATTPLKIDPMAQNVLDHYTTDAKTGKTTSVYNPITKKTTAVRY